MDVGRDTFAPYVGDLGNLCPESMPLPFFSSFILLLLSSLFYFYFYLYTSNLYLFIVLQLPGVLL